MTHLQADPARRRLVRRPVPGSLGSLASLAKDFDLVVLFFVLMADIRVLKGSAVASFTLFEIYIYGYCAPYIAGRLFNDKNTLPQPCLNFLMAVALYLTWLMTASLSSLIFRADNAVLQDTKNIVPSVFLVVFLLIRIDHMKQVYLLCNLYIVYSVAATLLGVVQYKFGGPYFRELIEGTEYKLDFEGNVVANPVVGFSVHPNQFALAILPAVALAGFKLVEEVRDRWRVRPTTLAVSMLLFGGLLLSQARGATAFGLAAIAFVASPLSKIRGFTLKFTFVAALVAAITVYGFHRAQSTGTPGADTIETRYLLWQTAFRAITSDFYVLLFGDGMPYVDKWSFQTAGWQFPDAHNAWIDQILFFGLPAALFYLAIWQQFFTTVERSVALGTAAQRAILNGIRATILAFMGDFFFEPVAHAVFSQSEFFLLMAIGARTVSLRLGARPAGTLHARCGTVD